MADSQLEMGTVRQAMAFKVKYRIKQSDGSWKTRVSYDIFGGHPHNRGKTFPNGLRCKSLCTQVLTMGVSRDEADHGGLLVEEAPQSRRFDDYNKEHSKGNPLLEKCFPAAFGVQFACLSHTHFSFVVKAFRGGAKWDMPPMQMANGSTVQLCDSHGRLTFEHIQMHPNGEELKTVSDLGFLAEVLGHQIETEEQGACGLIARALNMSNDACLGTTEMQAFDCLTGAVSFQMSADLAQVVSFDSVRAAVASQLDVMADDPDLVELFDLVISLGGAQAKFIAKLQAWASVLLDQSRRRMRLAGFKVVNGISDDKPNCKSAAIKLAYRGDVTNGYVQNPDRQWEQKDQEQELCYLEQALRYIHDTCQQSISCMPSAYDQTRFLASADCSLAHAWLTQMKLDKRKCEAQLTDLRRCMAIAVNETRKQMQSGIHSEARSKIDAAIVAAAKKEGADQTGIDKALEEAAARRLETWIHKPADEAGWLVDDLPHLAPVVAGAEKPVQPSAKATNLLARVLRFDPVSGDLLNEQVKPTIMGGDSVASQIAAKSAALPVIVEWAPWLTSDAAKSLSMDDDMRSLAFTAMHSVHRPRGMALVTDMAVQIAVHLSTIQNRFSVVALKDLQAGELMIPPWVANLTKLSCKPENELDPNHIAVLVKYRGNTVHGDASVEAVPGMSPLPDVLAAKVFVLPESGLPPWQLDNKHGAVEFNITSKTRLHPFWVVDRLNANDARKAGKPVNCEFKELVCTNVSISQFGKATPGSTTHEVVLPCITNPALILKGETIVLQKKDNKKKPDQVVTWKDQAKKAAATSAAKRMAGECEPQGGRARPDKAAKPRTSSAAPKASEVLLI